MTSSTAISCRSNVGPGRVVHLLLLGMLLLGMLLWAAGCDTVEEGGEGTITLPPEELEFRFEFDGSAASQEALSEGTIDLAEVLPLAYTKDEVQRVTVSSAELVRISTGTGLGTFLQQATFSIRGGGASPAVATISDPPDARSAPMDVSGGGNVTRAVTGDAFRGVLQVSLDDVPDNPYVLEVRAEVRIEVVDV